MTNHAATTEETRADGSPKNGAGEAGVAIGAVLDRVPSAVVALNTEFKIAYLNPVAVKLLESLFARRAEIGEELWSQFPELRGTVFEENCRQALLENKASRFEMFEGRTERTFNVQMFPCAVGMITLCQEITERKRTEKELAVAHERLENALTASAIATWRWDMKSNRVTGDDRMARLFRLDPERMQAGLPLPEFLAAMPPENRQPILDALGRAVAGDGRYERECRLAQPDGTVRWMDARGLVERDSQGEAIALPGVLVDITARKQAEEARLHFRALFEAAPGLCLILEPREPFRILGASDAYLRATMTQRNTIVGQPVFDVFPDDPSELCATGVENLRTSLHRVLDTRQTDVMHVQRHPIRRPPERGGGFEERFWSSVNAPVFGTGGETEYIIHRVEDVTEFMRQGPNRVASALGELESRDRHMEADVFLRGEEMRKVNAELRAREEELRLIVDHIQDFALYSTDLEGRITRWNPGAEAMFGWREDEIVGQPCDKLFTEEDRQQGVPARERAEALAGDVAPDERWHVRKSGQRFFASGAMRPMWDADGNLRGFLKMARDTTRRKHQQENLEETIKQRTASLRETVQQLETFSYSVVHDMRAPLRAMASFTSLLEEEFGDRLGKTGHDYVERIKSAADRLDGLITDVLDYSRISSGGLGLGQVDIDHLVRDIVEGYPQFLECRQCIVVESPLPPVQGNTALLTQCVSNLLGNAIKFVPPGRAPRVRVFAETRGDRVRLWFEDNGIGIDPEYQQKIFGLFERLHGPDLYPGTGVGLAIVAKAVQRMNGSLGVESAPGEGSRFWIELPAA